MAILIWILVFAVIGLVIYLLTLDGDYLIDRSLVINAPVEQTYRAVVDFKTWPQWSPWLMHEPDTELQYSDRYDQPDGYYTWDGKLVGAGKITHVSMQENESIEQRIEFLRPFKSTSRVAWTFSSTEDGGTVVHWIMQGRMPFLFRFMTAMMKPMISRDYDLGLHLLNGYLNPDNPHPQIEFGGEQQLDGFRYAYRAFSGHIDEMVETMQREFPDLVDQVVAAGIVDGLPLTIYHKADTKNMNFDCDMAVPIKVDAVADELQTRELLGGRYYRVECQGDYQFLELAWYKAHSHVRMLKLKLDNRRPALEIYENDAREIEDSSELRTAVYLPIKG
jgi:DNA gyrase inhibitor GyrI/uncharacterized protein YndB with AHSA1/START domain